jgi:hypothetical protein
MNTYFQESIKPVRRIAGRRCIGYGTTQGAPNCFPIATSRVYPRVRPPSLSSIRLTQPYRTRTLSKASSKPPTIAASRWPASGATSHVSPDRFSERGARVRLDLDGKGFIRSLQVLNGCAVVDLDLEAAARAFVVLLNSPTPHPNNARHSPFFENGSACMCGSQQTARRAGPGEDARAAQPR